MTTAAVIIGIDNYVGQPLTSAVNDAQAFQQTLLKLKLVEAKEIITLIAPQGGGRDDVTKDKIKDALFEFYEHCENYERLYFFFAGHGLLTYSDQARTRVRTVLLPSNVENLAKHGDRLLDVSELQEILLHNGPEEQFFFIDACRDLQYDSSPAVGSLGWGDGRPIGPQRRQATLYAVSPLGKAEAAKGGLGRMTSHLITGMESRDLAVEYDEMQGWVITMRSLADYVQEEVSQALVNEPLWKIKYMTPQLDAPDPQPSPLLVVANPGKPQLKVHIAPEGAAAETTVAIFLRGQPLLDSSLPPRQNHESITLTPQRHLLEATSTLGPVAPQRKMVDLRREREVVITVAAPEKPRSHTMGFGFGGILLGGDYDAVAAPARPPAAPPAPAAHKPREPLVEVMATASPVPAVEGRVEARALEPQVAVELEALESPRQIWQDEQELIAQVPVGPYRVRFRLGSDPFSEAEIYVKAGETVKVTPRVDAGPLVQEALGLEKAAPDVIVSESIGPIQAGILPTLLPIIGIKPFDTGNQLFHLFQGLVEPVNPESLDLCTISLVVAVDGVDWQTAQGLPASPQEVLSTLRGRLVLDHKEPIPLDLLPLRPTAPWGTGWGTGFDRLRLSVSRAWPGPFWLELISPVFGSFRIASAGLPHRATVVTITLHPDGGLDIAQNLLRFPGRDDLYGDELVPHVSYGRMLRDLQLGQQLYRRGDLLGGLKKAAEAGSQTAPYLLYAKWMDPVLSCMAYFECLRQKEHEGPVDKNWLMDATARNLNRFFTELPDSRVIYGLWFPGEREPIFARLLENGEIPVLAASAQHLASYAEEQGKADAPVAEISRRIAPDQVWTVVELD
jgi:hypothetical protein